MSDLHIDATPDLLDGWTGPVLLEERGTPNWIPGAAVDGKHVMAWIGPVGFYDVVSDRVRLRLDLSRAECRDRHQRLDGEGGAGHRAGDRPPRERDDADQCSARV